jgi:predicted RND superfamily exporter protein
MVGYGSLLQSASGGIRSFGAAATLGEVTCLLTALTLAPALLALLDGKRAATVNAPDEDEPRRAAG